MRATEFIKMSLEMSHGWIMGLIADAKDIPLTQPTPNGGNHPLWILGHLLCSESNLVDVFMQNKPNRYPQWKEIFDQGTTPSTDANDYPSMDELLAEFEKMRADTLAYLATLSDADLDKKSHAPEEMAGFFGTVGACYAAVIVHMGYHGGQVADARRAAGKAVLMA